MPRPLLASMLVSSTLHRRRQRAGWPLDHAMTWSLGETFGIFPSGSLKSGTKLISCKDSGFLPLVSGYRHNFLPKLRVLAVPLALVLSHCVSLGRHLISLSPSSYVALTWQFVMKVTHLSEVEVASGLQSTVSEVGTGVAQEVDRKRDSVGRADRIPANADLIAGCDGT